MTHFRSRPSLLWLIVPFVMFVLAIPFANRVHPVILGLPFLAFWTLLGVLVTPPAIWLAARGDPYFARDEPEGTDVD